MADIPPYLILEKSDETPYFILKSTIQRIQNDFGIKINTISVEWINISTPSKKEHEIVSIETNSEFI